MMSSMEMMKVLSKPWASVEDIKILASCGRGNATNIRDTISYEIEKTGKNLPVAKYKLVPMKNVIDYLNLDVENIFSMAEKEKKLERK